MRGTPPDDRKVPPEFGLLLRTLRAGAGLSQDGLAERAGISPKTIGALEQGVRRAAHDDTIRRIATALELRSEDREALLQAARHSRAHRLAQAEGLKTNLPSPLTSFIERPEVEEISALLGSNRLVTITGTGGVGKTRTAIEVAHRAKGSNHRFWFVDLSRLRDGSTILSELTNVLGIGVGDAGDEYAAVVRYLSARPSHLLFDNCEHLLEDLAGLVIRLFQSCPSLTILVTSREPLALSFETSYRLPVLDVPNGRIADIRQALEYSAIRLFFDRSESAGKTWIQTPASLEKISTLCRQLDGIPLAIELAAARVSTLGLDMLLEGLTRGLALSGKRDYPERHQTMTATIAWSYELLDSTEQAVLRRLSVFAGSFSLDVARRVCADEHVPGYSIVDVCHRLAQKSLIVVEPGEPIRYRLLLAIRAFCDERITAQERAAANANYIRWLVELSDWKGDFPIISIKPEFDNVRAGVNRCLELRGDDDIDNAAVIVAGLWLLWSHMRRLSELKQHVEFLLDRVPPSNTRIVSRLLMAACACSTPQDLPAATARAIPSVLAEGNYKAAAGLMSRLANVQFRNGDIDAARQSMEQSFSHLSRVDTPSGMLYWTCFFAQAWQACAQGNLAQANAALQHVEAYLKNNTNAAPSIRELFQKISAEVAFAGGDARAAIALLETEVEDSGFSFNARFDLRIDLMNYHTILGNHQTALEISRALIEEVAESEWSPVSSDVFRELLLPTALVAAVHDGAHLAARTLGHFRQIVSKQRPIWATEAPAYRMLLELLEAQLSGDELNELLDDGSATPSDKLLDDIRTSSLFGTSKPANAVALS